jgi:HK97 gp10 family phage protein
MSDSLSIEVTGVNELRQQLIELAKSVQADKVEPLLLEGAKTIRDTAKTSAPVGPTGNLKKALVAKLLAPISFGQPRTALAGYDRKKAPHAWLVEFGSPGRYKKKDSPGSARFRYKKGRYFGPMPANPVLRRAWDSTKNGVLGHIIDGLKQLIEKSVK